MKIDVVIPNYNGFNLIEKNLPILIKCIKKYDVGKIIIVDDFSESEDYDKLEEQVTGLKKASSIDLVLLRNDKNMGFSSTVDRGVEEAKSELVLLLNSDVLVQEKFLDAVFEDFKKDKNLFGVGMMDKSIEEGRVVLRGRGKASWQRGFLIHSRAEVNEESTFWVSGGSSIVRRDLFNKLSGFDSLYNPFYWEDIDLSYRAQKAGYSVKFQPKSIVEHYHLQGAIKKTYSPQQVKKIAYRNQFIFVWKNITDNSLVFSHILWLPYHIFSAVIRSDTALLWGFILAFLRIGAIINKRNLQKAIFKKKDTELLK